MEQKKMPLRMCVGCSKMKTKTELIRVVKNKEGEISLDKIGKMQGRGAYICNDLECLKLARKSKRISRSFKCQIPDDVYDRLEGEILEKR
jgi:predicted RNA-binding protein YlxR (DUF448 family)